MISRHTIDFTPHPDVKHYEKADKVVYYQTNPLANWGPASKAKSIKSAPVAKAASAATVPSGEKRKTETGEVGEGSVENKKPKVDNEEEEAGMNAA